MFPRRVFASIVKAAMSVFAAGCSSHVDPAASTGAPKNPGTPGPASIAGSRARSPKMSRQNESAQRYIDRGNQKEQSGDLAGAISEFTTAIEIDPTNALAWSRRGNAFAALRQTDRALADCSKAVELNPNWAIGWYNRGNIDSALGQHDKAIADFSKAIELEPDFAWGNRAASRAYNGDRDGAMSD